MAAPNVQLTLGICDVGVAFGQPIRLEPEQQLRLVQARVRCASCGAAHTVAAEPVFDTHDDDHFGRLELWYTTTHQVRCACGSRIELVLGHTETRNLLTDGRTMTWNGVRSRQGGDLA